jgi:hypothetical protein
MSEYLGDEFNSKTGDFSKYLVIGPEDIENGAYVPPETPTSVQAIQLEKQKHTDLRAIEPKSSYVLATMLHLTALFDMQTMQDTMMDELAEIFLVSVGETWTKGSISKDPARNNWSVLALDCEEGQETVFESFLRR